MSCQTKAQAGTTKSRADPTHRKGHTAEPSLSTTEPSLSTAPEPLGEAWFTHLLSGGCGRRSLNWKPERPSWNPSSVLLTCGSGADGFSSQTSDPSHVPGDDNAHAAGLWTVNNITQVWCGTSGCWRKPGWSMCCCYVYLVPAHTSSSHGWAVGVESSCCSHPTGEERRLTEVGPLPRTSQLVSQDLGFEPGSWRVRSQRE
jgi:hypothetical protein